ncbi:MAG TPA: sigma-54-dependent Fis family transcriptional regulator [Gammaproteobacteria bacterium]|nr:sigma-54-dependent Fis family transcriptional regulator [Gammaproteobacteria bacterium]
MGVTAITTELPRPEFLERHEMVGNSAAMRPIFRQIGKMARVDAPVMINGESGTGKELAARRIHALSSRASKPFVAVNCAAIPHNLIHSELFGHEKGAFTGATQRKIGRIESANGGTIFLDEIGDLSLDLQVNLLRFLQEGTIERVGGTESMELDIRVISATHVDLAKAVEEGRFREDLYYRLNVLHLVLPALREREGDILDIAEANLRKFAAESPGSKARGFTEDAKRLMNVYHWPGNIRELVNLVRRAVAMCDKELISPEDLGLERRSPERNHIATLQEIREAAERKAIISALRRNRDNIAATARQLGVSRVTLYKLIDKYGLSKQ